MWIGPPVSGIDGPEYCGWRENFYAVVDQNSNSSYFWDLSSWGSGLIVQNGYPWTSVEFYTNNTAYTLKLWATNQCGQGYAEKSLYASYRGPGIVIAYPNPVSDILTVDVDALAGQFAAGAQRQTTPAFDIRLYDDQGNLLRHTTAKGGTVEINVANLPDGVYYLHVYDGVNSTPVMQQIMVEH